MKTYCFQYVGSIEVTESRGTQVCAEAFRKMKEVFKVVVISYFFQNLMKLKRGHKLKPFVIFNCLEFNNVSAIWFPLCMISELNISQVSYLHGEAVCLFQVGTGKKKRMQLLITADCVRVVDEQTKVRYRCNLCFS